MTGEVVPVTRYYILLITGSQAVLKHGDTKTPGHGVYYIFLCALLSLCQCISIYSFKKPSNDAPYFISVGLLPYPAGGVFAG